MVAETLIGLIYNWVESSWQISTLLIKYALLGFAGIEIFRGSDLETAEKHFREYARYIVAFIVSTGLITSLIGTEIQPMIPIIGEFAALAFYAYIFWKY